MTFTETGVFARSPDALQDYFAASELADLQTVIEVIDLKRNAVSASSAFAGAARFARWPYVTQQRRQADGTYVVEVLRILYSP